MGRVVSRMIHKPEDLLYLERYLFLGLKKWVKENYFFFLPFLGI
jgi:hypothetical protein